MRAKSLVLILIALGCGLVASVGITQVMDKGGIKPLVDTIEICVAGSDMDIDEQLTAENVKLEAWPRNRVPPNAVLRLKDLEGQYASSRLVKGEYILTGKFRASKSSKTDSIPEGYRVATVKVQVDTITGIASPGDRVDIIAFLRKSGEVPQTVTRKVLKDVRVFAINEATEKGNDADGKAANVRTVSLLVKNEQVEPLMLASELGKLRMSLRRNGDVSEDNSSSVSVAKLLSGSAEDPDHGPGTGFLDMLKAATVAPPPLPPTPSSQPKPEQMVIMTPSGATHFRWDDPSGLPKIVTEGELDSSGDSNVREPTPPKFDEPSFTEPTPPAEEEVPRQED